MKGQMEDRMGINLQVPRKLVEHVDEVRGHVPRANWIREAMEEKLARLEGTDDIPAPTRQKVAAATRPVDKALLPTPVPGGQCTKHGHRTRYQFGAMICLECGTVMR